jgi:hypothetical protein
VLLNDNMLVAVDADKSPLAEEENRSCWMRREEQLDVWLFMIAFSTAWFSVRAARMVAVVEGCEWL